MSTPDPTSEYLFLFRGTDWDRSMSPAELQAAMARFVGWFEQLGADGILKTGQPLGDEARTVSGKGGRIVTDGLYNESKEAVGGYFLIKAASLDAAVTIAQQCPMLEWGAEVEVRPIAAQCPTLQHMQKMQAANQELTTAGV